MRRITILLLTTILLTGCTLEKNTTSVTDNIESSGGEKNIAPPQQIHSDIEYEVTIGETLTIKPLDIAKDLDGNKIYFTPEDILENSQMTITIKRDYIECKLKKDIEVDLTETFNVYVTDGTYRTEVEINITPVEEKTKDQKASDIPYMKGNPVVYDLNGKIEIEICPDDLATSKSDLQIESINGSIKKEGVCGTLKYHNSHKAVYTLNKNITTDSEEFVIIVTNGTNSVPVNIKIKLN